MGPKTTLYCRMGWQMPKLADAKIHHYFKQWRSEMFIECFILSLNKRHGISGRFTTNVLELKQCLQKKIIDKEELPKK